MLISVVALAHKTTTNKQTNKKTNKFNKILYRLKSPHLKQRQSAGSFNLISMEAISGAVSRVPSGS